MLFDNRCPSTQQAPSDAFNEIASIASIYLDRPQLFAQPAKSLQCITIVRILSNYESLATRLNLFSPTPNPKSKIYIRLHVFSTYYNINPYNLCSVGNRGTTNLDPF